MSNVSETEMNDFFNRMASTFVGLSSQAEELKRLKPEFDGLRNAVDSLQRRIDALDSSNTSLRDDLRTTWETVRQTERDRDNFKDDAVRLATDNEALQRQVHTMQGEINSLTAEVTYQTDRAIKAETDLGTTATQLEVEQHARKELTMELSSINENRNYWQEQATTHENAHREAGNRAEGLQYDLDRLRTQLESMQQSRDAAIAKLDAIQSVFKGVFGHDNVVPYPQANVG